jgi:hypothetical protein
LQVLQGCWIGQAGHGHDIGSQHGFAGQQELQLGLAQGAAGQQELIIGAAGQHGATTGAEQQGAAR